MAILVTCTKPKDRQELSKKDDQFIFVDYEDSLIDNLLAGIEGRMPDEYMPEQYFNELCALAQKHDVSALFNTRDYPGCIYASLIGKKLGIAAPDIATILTCQHKYYARCAQKKYVPKATPNFAIVRHDYLDEAKKLTFPLFVKPVKSYLSVLAKRVDSFEQLEEFLRHARTPEHFLIPFNWAVKEHTDFEYDGSYFIAEEMLHGIQVTVEGYVYKNEAGLIGIVDSHMIPGTISFERFVYPSRLPRDVQERMFAIAERFVLSIGLTDTLFNIEMMYDEKADTISIIEINPRMASQFSDLYQMVNGRSNYDVQYDIVKGRRPQVHAQGAFDVAASLVARQLSDFNVIAAPTKCDIQKAQLRFPELQYYPWVDAGDKLSDVLQDGTSYVYCWIHLGAKDMNELDEKYRESKELLPFVFEPV